MVRLLSVDYSLEKALGLLDMTIKIGDSGNGYALTADSADLELVSSFLKSEIDRYEKEPLDRNSFEHGLLDLETRCRLLGPLKTIKSLIDSAIRSEGDERYGFLLVLADEAIIIRADVSHRAMIVDATYPGLRSREASAFEGMRNPEGVLEARRKGEGKPPRGRLPS